MAAPKGNQFHKGHTKWRPEFLRIARKAAEFGATIREIGEFLDVSHETIHQWMHSRKDFANAIRTGKAAADKRVEEALYHRALGYKYDAKKIQLDREGNWCEREYVEHVPPDTTACIFWLKNRKPAEWRDRQEHLVEQVTSPDDLKRARERARSQA